MDSRVNGYKISRRIFPYKTYHSSSVWFVKKSSLQNFSIPEYENRLHIEVIETRNANNIFLDSFISFYPSEKRLIKTALKNIEDYRCNNIEERVYYKDAHAFYVYNYRLGCQDDRCPRTTGMIIISV